MPPLVDEAKSNLTLALRGFRATPTVVAVAVLSLALGIGANTAIFSIIDSLLLRRLPVKDPGQLALVTDDSPSHVRAWSYPVWTEIRDRADLFENSAAWSFTQFNLASGGETEFVEGMWASGSILETLGVRPLLGRGFTSLDDRPGGSPDGPVAVISDAFWRRRFGAAPDILGRALTFDGVAFTIVGVLPPGFAGPEIGRRADVILPVSSEPLLRGHDSFLDDSGITFLTVMVRLKPGQSLESGATALRHVQRAIREATLGEIGRFGSAAAIAQYLSSPFVLAPGDRGYAGSRDLRGLYELPLMAVMGIVALLLLIACVNVANLLAARAVARRHELSLRVALGATRGRLVRQLLTESALLYLAGAGLGVVLAGWWSGALVAQITAAGDPVFLDLALDTRVLAFTSVLTLLTTAIFGTVPALRASAASPGDALKQSRTMSGGRTHLPGALVVLQVSLSLVLVVASGLFVRTFVSLRARPLGFDPAPVLLVDVDAHHAAGDTTERLALYERIRDRVRAIREVSEAALSLTTPVGVGQFTPPVEIDGVADTRGPVWGNLVSPGWFATYQTPLLAGRDFDVRDRAGAARVAITNGAFARRFFPRGSPIGHTMVLFPGTPMAMGPIEIVGMSGDAVYSSLRDATPPTYYLPIGQFDYLTELGIRSINLSVRARTSQPVMLSKPIAAAVRAIDAETALTFRPLDTQVGAAMSQERLLASLTGFFGVLALLLAGLGLYGVAAYAVAMRRTELGIRMALGATGSRVFGLVMRRTVLLVGGGIVLGAGSSLWASRFVATLVYGLEPGDPATLAGAAVLLAIVAAVAAAVPARRASRLDPASVLREG
jgi:putative ABC transport system permease protein